jgi:hypothetical protein
MKSKKYHAVGTIPKSNIKIDTGSPVLGDHNTCILSTGDPRYLKHTNALCTHFPGFVFQITETSIFATYSLLFVNG